jgi:hypothetical protein
MALARGALLRRSDLGSGWTGSPASRGVPALTCSRFDPSLAGVVEQGAAVSPTFNNGSSGPFVSAVAYAYQTRQQATTLWGLVARPGLGRCVADSLVHGSGHGVTFAVTNAGSLPLPGLKGRHAAYRATGTASTTLQTIDVYLDMVLLGRGQTVATVSISSFFAPPSRAFELKLARTVLRRLRP